MHRLHATAGAAFLTALLPTTLPAQERMSLDEAAARYQDCISRGPYTFHTQGRDALAQTGSGEALAVLVEDYRRVKDYPEFSRYTLASLFGRWFRSKEHSATLAALRADFPKAEHAWLWLKALHAEIDADGDAAAKDVAINHRVYALRAAAILALGLSDRGELKTAILANCADFPRKESDRMVLVGAMTGALFEQRGRVNSDTYREALKAYISLLGDDVKLPALAKLQMARHLQTILRGPAKFVNPEPWLELLERGEVKTKTSSSTRAAQRFFGIESEGERICYVIDMSDSMCKDIDPDSKPKGPITGPRKKKKKGLVLDESDLPWHEIRTRWDLAREQLRISLSRLDSDKRFAIVWFGTEAGTLDSTKGMVKASKGNIKRVMAELDSIQPGEQIPNKAPDGTLRGRTNLHGGLRVAFGLCDRGVVDEAAFVDKNALTEGCDTIFLLSDGAPSWDDFGMVDRDYGEGKVVVDVEYGAEASRSDRLEYGGPYGWDPRWLIEDLHRMNAFRRIRMHCVGLGEANVQLLEQMAEIGNGEVFVVGRGK